MVFLIGMPGVGKTYWGKRLAEHLGVDFIDLDTYIEKKEKAPIATLFEIDGEEGFRDKEQQYLQRIILTAADDAVVACGGGTPCFYNNMDSMLANGTVIYLQANITYLTNNLDKENGRRPLLANGNLEPKLKGLLQKREEDYLRAPYILQTENISLTTFDKILNNV